jgi:hypothetical protein
MWYIFPRVIQINTKFANFAGLYFPHFTTFRLAARDAGTTGAAGASAPLAFCNFNFVGAVRVQTMGVTGAQNFHNRQN